MRYYLKLIVFCLVTVLGHAQPNPEEEFGSWYMLFGTHSISQHISVNTGMQLRYYENITNYNLDLFYTGINYHFNPRTSLTLNYGYLDIDRSIEYSNAKNTIEHRLWQQFTHKHQFWNIPIQHRIRLEQRFLNVLDVNSIQNRLRYRLGTTVKVNNTFFVVLNNEFFVNFSEELFRENRVYAALGINIIESVKLQLGYMRQYINSLDLNRLQFGIYIKTDLRRTSQ